MKKLLILSLIAGSAILMGFTPAENATSQTIAIGSGSKVIQDFNNLKNNVFTKDEIYNLLETYDDKLSVLGNDITSAKDSIYIINSNINGINENIKDIEQKLKNIPQAPETGGTVISGNINIEETADGVIVTNYIENGELIIDGKTLLAAYNQGKRTFHTDVDTPKFFMQKIYSMYFDGIENVTDMEFDIEINGLNSDIQFVAFPYVESKYVSFTTNDCQNTSVIPNVTEYIDAVSSDPNDTNKYQAKMEVPDSEYVRKDTYHIVKNDDSNEMKWNVALTKRTNGTTDPYIPMSTDTKTVFSSGDLSAMIANTNTLEVDCSTVMKKLTRGYNTFLVEFIPPTNTEYNIKNIVLNNLNELPETEFKNVNFELTINRLNRNIENMWINDGNNTSYFITNGLNNVCKNVYEKYDETDNGNGNTSFKFRYTPNHDRVSVFNIRKMVTGTYTEQVPGIFTNEVSTAKTENGANVTETSYTYTPYTNIVSRPITRWVIKHDLNVD